MNSERRPPRNPSAVWGEGTSWVLGDPQKAEEGRDSAAPLNEQVKRFSRPASRQREPQEEQMTAPGQQKKKAKDVFDAEQAALWEELYDWGLRVRRDILALEVCAKQLGCEFDGTKNDSRETTKLHIKMLLKQLEDNDPGDPPGGPFDNQ